MKIDEDFEAFAMRHSYAVAYKDFAYKNLAQEQEVIERLLQSVMLMRELPLSNIVKDIEHANHIQDVSNQAKRLSMLKAHVLEKNLYVSLREF
jgi:hypothetical protein